MLYIMNVILKESGYWVYQLQQLQQNINENQLMDNNNSSLLGFLQKKSLFSNSPNNRTRNRSRSGSKDGRFIGAKSNVYQLDDRSEAPSDRSGNKFNYLEDNLKNYQNNLPRNNNQDNSFKAYQNNPPVFAENKMYQPSSPVSDLRANQYQSTPPANLYQAPQINQYQSQLRGVQAVSPISQLRGDPYQEQRYFKASQARTDRFQDNYQPRLLPDNQVLQNQIWSGLVAHTTSFESARIESIQCLQSLSSKLAGEISSINFKIDSFNSKMGKMLSSEFRAMREKILQIFDQVFKESEKFIKDYMKQQETKLAGDMVKARELLTKEHARIEAMKQELRKTNWRKTAGEILTSELEKHIEENIRKSGQITIGHWQLGDLGGQHIRNIESELREIVRMKPIR